MMGACAVLEDGVEEPQGIAAPRMIRGFDERPGGTEGGAMRYSFGDYVLDTARQELQHAGAPVQLRRKVFQVLAYLLAHRARVVPKQELLEQLWPDPFVGDEALTSCVRTLRQVLGERGRTPRFLRTVHGQGYHFVAAVAVQESSAADDVPPTLPLRGSEGATGQAEGPSPILLPPPADLGSRPVAALGGEYKQVTVLGGALAEAPTLAARLGPEAMYHLMHEVLALTQETVQRYDGTLLYISGEGFLALFGAPVAQEDHARRAVLAACELRQRVHAPAALRGQMPGVALRLGLHSGPVVVGPRADAPQQPYIAAGATLQVVTWLQQRPAPDTILVSATTYALVQDEVEGEACESVTLDEPSPLAPVYAIHGLRRRRAGVPRRGARPLSRFVGRTQELALLHARLAQAVSGQGQVLGIVGEPGLGKSRLLAEFTHSLHRRPVTYGEGHCLAYGRATPYLPVRDLLRQLWDLSDSVPALAITATVSQRLHEAGVASEAETLLLLQLLDVPVDLAPLAALDPPTRKARTFALLWHLIRHTSQRQPLVLAVENLHWSDPTSDEWLASLVERLGDTPVLLVVTYRPGYQPPWLGRAVATQIALPRLSLADSLAVLQSVPQAAQLAAPVQQAIVAKAAGNPFFVEELTWAAVAHGTHAGSLPLPDTIEAVLAARLDRLPPEAKRLVQIAAVMGPEVPVPLLHRLAGLPEDALQRGLAHLQAAEFLYETQLFPEPVYAFKHALTREVAYASLLHERRRILHAQIVEALEMLAGDRLDEQVERLAQHAFRGEVWDKAVAYYQQAGAKAHARAAWHEAVTCCEQALTALTHLPEISDRTVLAIDLRRSLGRALELLGEYDRARTHLKEAESLARALDDRARLGRVLVDIVQSRRMQADYANAMAVGQRALAIAAELGDRALQVAATQRLASVHFAIGDFGQAAVLLRRNVEVLESGAPDPGLIYGSQSRAWLALVLSTCGVFTEGRRYGDEALRLATTVKAMPTVANGCLGLLYLTKGDVEHAIQVLDPGRAFCRTTGNRDWGRWITAGLGHAYALAGRITEGLTLLEETLRDDLHACALNAHSEHVARLSEACRLAGYHDNAWQHARQALALARQYQERGYEAFALYQLGAVHASADPPEVEPAATHYRQALTLTEELGMRPLQAHCHLGLGTLYAQTGRRAQARAALGTAIALYRAMDMTFWLPQAEGALAQVDRR